MIPYHGTPLGGKSCERPRFFTNRHALVSFMRQDDLEVISECCRSFCFDNGAFSAWRSGKPITDWKPYYEWCKQWIRHPGLDFILMPDVIEGSELDNDMAIADFINWKGWQGSPLEIRRWHLADRLCPVWHMHESIDRLVRLCNGWSRVAFGSSGDYSSPGSQKWTMRCHEAFEAICVGGYPISRIHGLRMMNPAIFHRFPFSSVDSTNVAQNASREAKAHSYRDHNGVEQPISMELAREIIAGRIEKHNSAQCYRPTDKQRSLFYSDDLMESFREDQ